MIKDFKNIPNEVILYCYYDIILTQHLTLLEDNDKLFATLSKITNPNFTAVLAEKRVDLFYKYRALSGQIINDENSSVETRLKRLTEELGKSIIKSEEYTKLEDMHDELFLLLDGFHYETYEKGIPIIVQRSKDNKQECHSLILTKGNLVYIANNNFPQTLYTSKDEGKVNNYLHKGEKTKIDVSTNICVTK